MWKLIATAGATLLGVLAYANLTAGEKRIQRSITNRYSIDSDDFRRALGVLLGPEVTEGNTVRLLRNGDEIFPAMLDAIGGARETICFETFIYWSGSIGQRFADALCERARAGVRVHVLLDWLGSQRMSRRLLHKMQACGVVVQRYHRPSIFQLRHMNHRTHRKLLVIDGRIGFTGGVGIADTWLGHAQDPQHWRDSHFRVEGPAVAQIQAVFLDNWIKATGEVLHGSPYFPPLERVGSQSAQMFGSSAAGGSASMHLLYLLAITAARERIVLSSAYFVPGPLAVKALVDAAERGVDIRILVPGRHIDVSTIRKASRSLWPPLLKAGIAIAEYQPTMFHCKVLVIDDCFVSIGSTNFDNRSFQLNDEANLNVLDADFAREQVRVFEEDWQRGRRVRRRDLKRDWLRWQVERLVGTMRPQL
ncbi:phospholipase D-like domain-containing protein [Ramlibacter sp. AN1015]|uniref:phospholipase D-like domain-containing protein n=1 Tax=Ramlibacter sp. AN1015 TaxID=3133428 RepID=UPI0030BA75E4